MKQIMAGVDMKKKWTTGVWIVGTVSLIFVTVNLSFTLPDCNDDISKLQDDLSKLEYSRENRFMNQQLLRMSVLHEEIICIQLSIFEILNIPEQVNLIKGKRKKAGMRSISKAYLALMGKIPPQTLKDEWANMSTTERSNAANDLVGSENFTTLYDDIKKKKSEVHSAENHRSAIIMWTGIFQVLGLLLISVSQFFKEHTKP